jgi:uncharacterized protein
MSDSAETILADVLARMADLPQFSDCLPLNACSRGAFDETPLHVAAIWGDEHAILALLNAGADVDARGERGHTPLHEAVGAGHVAAVKLLLGRGASQLIRNDDGLTAVELANLLGESEIAGMLRK